MIKRLFLALAILAAIGGVASLLSPTAAAACQYKHTS